MSNPKVSIVIPCYNVEKYLKQCLESVVNQTLKEIEIICVNDGSKDSTLSIIQEFARTDDRIKVISQENGGYGKAMNNGFSNATGEYIGIVESDDFVDPDMFEKLYIEAAKNDLDVVKSSFYFYWGKQDKSIKYRITNKINRNKVFCPAKDFKNPEDITDYFSIFPSIWSAIYKNSFIKENNIKFLETPGASFQDTSFNFKVYSLAEKSELYEKCFLHYRQDNEQSSINNPGKVYCICDEYKEIEMFLLSQPELKDILEPVKMHNKVDAYLWNYDRLNESFKQEFIEYASKDLKEDMDKGYCKSEYFDYQKWNLLLWIIDKPLEFHEWKMNLCKNAFPEYSTEGNNKTISSKLTSSLRKKGFWVTTLICAKHIFIKIFKK